jgi:hypothetical protein
MLVHFNKSLYEDMFMVSHLTKLFKPKLTYNDSSITMKLKVMQV